MALSSAQLVRRRRLTRRSEQDGYESEAAENDDGDKETKEKWVAGGPPVSAVPRVLVDWCRPWAGWHHASYHPCQAARENNFAPEGGDTKLRP